MRVRDRISAYFFAAACMTCIVAQSYLQGFYTAQDEVRRKMAYGDWLLTMEVASKEKNNERFSTSIRH